MAAQQVDILPQEFTLNNVKFVKKQELGRGAYGVVFSYEEATPRGNVSQKLAAKCDISSNNTISKETYFMGKMMKAKLQTVPTYHGERYNSGKSYIIMQLVEYSIDGYLKEFKNEGNRLTFPQICDNMLSALQSLHDINLIHLDVKPENFRISDENKVYIFDFGLVNDYAPNGRHKAKGKFGFQGSPYYASINALNGFTLSRRDDIESLGYSIMQLIDRDQVPWKDKDNYREIKTVKEEFLKPTAVVPEIFIGIRKFIIRARNLAYEEDPDYNAFRHDLRCMVKKLEDDLAVKAVDRIREVHGGAIAKKWYGDQIGWVVERLAMRWQKQEQWKKALQTVRDEKIVEHLIKPVVHDAVTTSYSDKVIQICIQNLITHFINFKTSIAFDGRELCKRIVDDSIKNTELPIIAREQYITFLKEVIGKLLKEIEGYKQNIQDLIGNVAALEGTISQLQEWVTQLEGEIAQLKQNVANEKVELEKVQREIVKHNDKIEFQKSTIEGLKQEEDKAQKKLLTTNTLISQAENRFKQLNDTNANLHSQNLDEEEKLKVLTKRKEELLPQVRDLEDLKKNLTTDNDSKQKDKHALEVQLSTLNTNYSTTLAKYKSWQVQLTQIQGDFERETVNLTARVQEVQSENKKKENLERECKQIATVLNETQVKVQNEAANVRALEEKKSKLSEDISKLEKAHKSTIREFESQQNSLLGDIARLQEQKEYLTAENKGLEQKNSVLTANIQAAQKSYAGLLKDNEDANKAHKKLLEDNKCEHDERMNQIALEINKQNNFHKERKQEVSKLEEQKNNLIQEEKQLITSRDQLKKEIEKDTEEQERQSQEYIKTKFLCDQELIFVQEQLKESQQKLQESTDTCTSNGRTIETQEQTFKENLAKLEGQKLEIQRQDEILKQLRENIDSLQTKVQEETATIERVNSKFSTLNLKLEQLKSEKTSFEVQFESEKRISQEQHDKDRVKSEQNLGDLKRQFTEMKDQFVVKENEVKKLLQKKITEQLALEDIQRQSEEIKSHIQQLQKEREESQSKFEKDRLLKEGQIKVLEIQIDSQNTQVSNITTNLKTQEDLQKALQANVDDKKSQISSLKQEVNDLEGQKRDLMSQLSCVKDASAQQKSFQELHEKERADLQKNYEKSKEELELMKKNLNDIQQQVAKASANLADKQRQIEQTIPQKDQLLKDIQSARDAFNAHQAETNAKLLEKNQLAQENSKLTHDRENLKLKLQEEVAKFEEIKTQNQINGEAQTKFATSKREELDQHEQKMNQLNQTIQKLEKRVKVLQIEEQTTEDALKQNIQSLNDELRTLDEQIKVKRSLMSNDLAFSTQDPQNTQGVTFKQSIAHQPQSNKGDSHINPLEESMVSCQYHLKEPSFDNCPLSKSEIVMTPTPDPHNPMKEHLENLIKQLEGYTAIEDNKKKSILELKKERSELKKDIEKLKEQQSTIKAEIANLDIKKDRLQLEFDQFKLKIDQETADSMKQQESFGNKLQIEEDNFKKAKGETLILQQRLAELQRQLEQSKISGNVIQKELEEGLRLKIQEENQKSLNDAQLKYNEKVLELLEQIQTLMKQHELEKKELKQKFQGEIESQQNQMRQYEEHLKAIPAITASNLQVAMQNQVKHGSAPSQGSRTQFPSSIQDHTGSPGPAKSFNLKDYYDEYIKSDQILQDIERCRFGDFQQTQPHQIYERALRIPRIFNIIAESFNRDFGLKEALLKEGQIYENTIKILNEFIVRMLMNPDLHQQSHSPAIQSSIKQTSVNNDYTLTVISDKATLQQQITMLVIPYFDCIKITLSNCNDPNNKFEACTPKYDKTGSVKYICNIKGLNNGQYQTMVEMQYGGKFREAKHIKISIANKKKQALELTSGQKFKINF